jgi:apolipoprotein N-acyltransferase
VRGPVRATLAVLSGALAACGSEPVGLPWLLPLAVAGLVLAGHGLRGRRAFGVGAAFGVAYMLLLLPWLRVIGTDAWIGLSILEASAYGLLGLALGRVQRLPGWPLWAAACWVAAEWLRATIPWGGFPWGRLSFAVIDTPLAPLLGLLGTAGTSYVVALLGTTLAYVVLTLRRRPLAAVGAGLAALLLVPVLVGLAALAPEPHTTGRLRVAAVQGDVPGEGMEAFAERRAVLDNHVAATLGLAARIDAGRSAPPDLVLWPENSTDIDPFRDPTVFADIQRAVDAVGAPTLVGAMVEGPGPHDIRNQGIVWLPGAGPTDRYSKQHPVPFGEYIPMRAQLARIFERLDQIPRDMVRGTEPGVLDVAGTTIGDLICFEVAYDDLVREVVDGGAELLVVQTNNATYMGTGQVEQQFAIARLRAIETGRYAVVVATNGVSGIVGPDGSVLRRAPVREPAILEDQLPLRVGTTVAVRLGAWPERLLVGVALLGILLASPRLRRSRQDPPTAVTQREPLATSEASGRVGA